VEYSTMEPPSIPRKKRKSDAGVFAKPSVPSGSRANTVPPTAKPDPVMYMDVTTGASFKSNKDLTAFLDQLDRTNFMARRHPFANTGVTRNIKDPVISNDELIYDLNMLLQD
jgi:hypothetical protein